MPFVQLARLEDLPPGALLEASHKEIAIALCNVDGTVRAFQGQCPHLNGPLGHGNLHHGNIVCPWHAWEFSAITGEYDYNPNVRLASYPVQIRDNAIYVELP